MSHYTSIKTEYNNKETLKKFINILGYPYAEDSSKNKLEIFLLPSKKLSFNIYDCYHENYLAFKLNTSTRSYNIITDSQSWTQKELIRKFLKNLQINYNYSETIFQALRLGFKRSKIFSISTDTKFIFQRCIAIK